jgi:mono/diheme cytochrome c family protein
MLIKKTQIKAHKKQPLTSNPMFIINTYITKTLKICFFICLFSPATAISTEGGKSIFEQRCHRCHDLPDPGKPPEMGWEKRLKIMAKLAKLTPEQKTDVLSYLQSHSKKAEKTISLADEQRLFEQKCSLCHTLDRIFLKPLDDESRQHIVKRMQGKIPGWISEEEAKQVIDYLSKAPKVKRVKKAKDIPAEIFQERCSACHTLERIYNKINNEKAPSWMHIVQRMQEKAPQWLSQDEARLVIEYLKSIK